MDINRVREHHMEDQEPERRKGKRPENDNLIIRRQPLELALRICRAEGIDDDKDPVVIGQWYRVLYWIEPDKMYQTRVVQAVRNNPEWEEVDFLPILDYIPGKNYDFLHVEVARLYSDTDPGPSSGSVIVGRARVPLPRVLSHTIENRFELVRPTGNGHMCLAGDIILCMQFQRA